MTTEELIHKITGVCFENKQLALSIEADTDSDRRAFWQGRDSLADDIIELLQEFSKPERKE